MSYEVRKIDIHDQWLKEMYFFQFSTGSNKVQTDIFVFRQEYFDIAVISAIRTSRKTLILERLLELCKSMTSDA